MCQNQVCMDSRLCELLYMIFLSEWATRLQNSQETQFFQALLSLVCNLVWKWMSSLSKCQLSKFLSHLCFEPNHEKLKGKCLGFSSVNRELPASIWLVIWRKGGLREIFLEILLIWQHFSFVVCKLDSTWKLHLAPVSSKIQIVCKIFSSRKIESGDWNNIKSTNKSVNK